MGKFIERLKEKKVFIPLIIALAIFIGLGSWWIVSSRQLKSPQDAISDSDKLISIEIANNSHGEVNLTDFTELLDKDEIEAVYLTQKEREYGSVGIYYIKIKAKEGYYLVQVPPGAGYSILTAEGWSVVDLNNYLYDLSRKIYGRHIAVKVLSAVPKLPPDKTQFIILGVFLVVFVLITFFLIRPGGILGGFGKARTQDMKKPVYFEDVGGIDEALEESKEVAELIKVKWGGKWR